MAFEGTSGKMATASSPVHPATSHLGQPQRESLPQQRAPAGRDAPTHKPESNCCSDSRATMMDTFPPLRHLRAYDRCVCMCLSICVCLWMKEMVVPLKCLWERCGRQIFTLFAEDRAIYALAREENKIHKWSLKCAEGFKVFAICWDITRFSCLLAGFFGAQVCGE